VKLKLRAKLLVAFFLLIAIPCTVLGYVSYRQSSQALRTTIEAQLQSMVNDTAELVDQSLYMTQEVVEVAGNKTELVTAAATGNAEPAVAAVKALKTMNGDRVEDVIVADKSGQVIVSSSGAAVSIKDRNYFTKVIGGEKVISDVILSKSTNKSVIVIAQPLKQDGQVVGVLAMVMDFGSLVKHVDEIKVGATGYGYIIDNTGAFIHHPDKNLVLKSNMLQDEQTKAVAEKMLANNQGKDIYTIKGVEKLVAYKSVGHFIIAMTVPVEEYMAPAKTVLRDTIIVVLLGIIIALGIAFVVANSIVRPVNRLRELMAAAGEGDLTVVSEIDAKDEIGDLSKSFDVMIKHQNTIVKEVRDASQQLAAASEEMAASCQETTATSEEITGSMQTVAAEAENGNTWMIEGAKVLVQLSSLIKIAENKAGVAAHNSNETYATAEEGRLKVTETVNKMQNIKDQTEKTSDIIADLNNYSKQIGQIVDTITAIAAQTDLLALNAAIESARAGEHGRGFAVVAEEVRKLAEQSNQRAREISDLIGQVTDKTKAAVDSMSLNMAEVETGVAIVNETGSALDSILEAVKRTVAEIEGINSITGEEVANSEQIVKLINQLATVVESVATHCEQVATGLEQQSAAMQTVASSAEETSASANSLSYLVERFKI